MVQIADLRNIIHDGKYTLYVLNNIIVRVYNPFMNEVYSAIEFSGECKVSHILNTNHNFTPESILPIDVHNIHPGLFHTMTINKGYLTIDDVLGRRVFSIRPDGFHYTFEYSSNGDNFPSIERDSDGVTREYEASIHDGIISCLQTTNDTLPIELYLVDKDSDLK